MNTKGEAVSRGIYAQVLGVDGKPKGGNRLVSYWNKNIFIHLAVNAWIKVRDFFIVAKRRIISFTNK